MSKYARAAQIEQNWSVLKETEAAIDLVHLSRQTLGDTTLETELLKLFDRQAQQLAIRLAAPAGRNEGDSRAELAHMLKGSARAIGAFELADAADAYETAVRAATPEGGAQNSIEAWGRLAAAIDRARGSVARLL